MNYSKVIYMVDNKYNDKYDCKIRNEQGTFYKYKNLCLPYE